MRELETLVDGFKTDQKEIESVIVRTLHNLDELEESAAAAATPGGIQPDGIQAATEGGNRDGGIPAPAKRAEARKGVDAPTAVPRAVSETPGAAAGMPPGAAADEKASGPQSPKEELDIF